MMRGGGSAAATPRFPGAPAVAPVLAAVVALAVAVAGCAVRVPRTVSVTFPGPAGTMHGAIYFPDGPGPHPGIVLVHGARRVSYREFAHEARAFAERGIAALAYDTRGTGGSTGDRALAKFEHLAGDARAAAAFLRAHDGVDAARVGVWGFGQGGWIAPLAAADDSTIAYVVLVSAPVVSPLDALSYRREEELVAGGMKRSDAQAIVRLRRRIWEYWLAPAGSGTASSDSLRRAFDAVRGRPWFAPAVEARDLPETLPPDEGMGNETHPARRWIGRNLPLFWSLTYDPAGAIRRLRAPLLAIYGGDDREVPVEASERALRRAAGARYGRGVIVRLFPDADHSLRRTGGAGWWRRAGDAPGYRDSVVAWIGRR